MSRSSLISPQEKKLALLLVSLAVFYISGLLLTPSQWLPGDPIWALQPDTVQEIIDESINFFFVLPLVNQLGIRLMEAPAVHPTTQAFFNFAEAWIFMFLPLLRLDPRGQKLPVIWVWSGAMFLTNIFLMPYMAARLWRHPEDNIAIHHNEYLAKSMGLISLFVGTLAVVWAIFWQPEVGGLTERFTYFVEQLLTDRVTLAFGIDITLFYLFQIWLMGAIIPKENGVRWLRFIPFWGLSMWLIGKDKPLSQAE